MSKGLEALKRILNKRCGYCPFNHEDMSGEECEECDKYDDVVEKELKRLEEYDKLFEKYGFEHISDFEDYVSLLQVDSATKREDKHKIITLKKALEIIKTKEVEAGYLMHRIKQHNLTYEEYLYDVKNCLDAPISQELLTQEEYELLEEVLL